ncbi:MAG: hypothetical protein DVB33_02485 [Verrucomicrobia bacterium]|jgi:hypothetical protein|nr:MAG: hypothetical protein DVB33_02485 [Verrucomicrobiota bacterium]
MNLNDAQQKTVAEWVAGGMKLAEVQTRIASEFGLQLTYMEVRFLVDDLKLRLKDPETPKPVALPATDAPVAPVAVPETPASLADAAGQVALSVDKIARPGTMVSGSVTFSDGANADWYLDQTGRLGVVPKVQGYKPTQEDVLQFQAALEREMSKMGF